MAVTIPGSLEALKEACDNLIAFQDERAGGEEDQGRDETGDWDIYWRLVHQVVHTAEELVYGPDVHPNLYSTSRLIEEAGLKINTDVQRALLAFDATD